MVILNANNFRTEYHPKPSAWQFDHSADLLTIGSCFSDKIGQKLLDHKFSTLVNPLGTVYNPISIFRLLHNSAIDEEKFVEVGGQYFHLDFHSSFTAREKSTLKTVLDLKTKEMADQLKQVDCVIITLGTAYVYELVSNGEVVANCHKVPQKKFKKRLLSLDEMSVSFNLLKAQLDGINPSLQYIFTLSPVRHLKDGLVENQLSKSLLRVLCHEWSKNERVAYFPAYELMMDDLRDYRFYKTDMIHPTEMAEDYIWEIFQQTYCSGQTQKIQNEWNKIQTALAHKPFNPDSVSHQKFLKNQLVKLDVFAEYFDVSEERAKLNKQLR